jgi:hypothetical protein
MTQPRMEMKHNRAPYALPALILGIVAVALSLIASGGLIVLLGVGATMLGGVAWADTRSHGYDGAGMALAGAVLGVVAVVLWFVGLVVM